MAGFDFSVAASPQERQFIRSLLRLSQRLAGFQGLKLSYRWQADAGYYVTVDGSLPSMQSFLEPLVTSLLSHAEGSTGFRPPSERKKIARRITGSYADGLDRITESVHRISELFGGRPNSYSFDVGEATHLQGHLNSFTEALTLYHQGRIVPHQIAELSHSALELLLKNALGPESKGQSFESMVRSAAEKQLLDTGLVNPLVHLKNLRRDAKHRGQGISHELFNDLLPSILSSAHELAQKIRSDYQDTRLGA